MGGCTYDAAEAVCDADPDRLQSLLDKSLLRRRESVSGARATGCSRRSARYAVERLAAAGELEALRRGHARYFIAQADERDERGFSIAHRRVGLALGGARQPPRRVGLGAGDEVTMRCSRWGPARCAPGGLERLGRGRSSSHRCRARSAGRPADRCRREPAHRAASDLARFTGDGGSCARGVPGPPRSRSKTTTGSKATSNADMAEILIHRGELDDAEAHLRESLRLGGGVRAKASLAELELARGRLRARPMQLRAEAERGFRGVHAYNLLATRDPRRRSHGGEDDAEEARLWFATAPVGRVELSEHEGWPPTVSTARRGRSGRWAISLKPIDRGIAAALREAADCARFVRAGGAVTLVPLRDLARAKAIERDDGPTSSRLTSLT